VDTLAEELPRQPPEFRRFLLAIKRDSFNGRSLKSFSSRTEWGELNRLTGDLASMVLDLEQRVVEAEQRFAELYGRELERERGHLCRVLRDERFLRGLALGSPELVSRARLLLDDGIGSLGRHGHKVEQSLLRFITRSAAKTSPYSTLTTLGLGLITNEIAGGFRFISGPLREVSLVRANSSLLQRGREILMRHPRLRELCLMVLNNSTQEVAPGQWQFLRNSHWTFDEEAGDLRFVPARFIRVRLAGPVVASVVELLADGPLPFAAFVATLRERHPDRRDEGGGCPIKDLVDHLETLGFLCRLPLWETSEVHIEKRMLETLQKLSSEAAEPTLKNLETALNDLLTLEREYATSARSEKSSRELTATLNRVMERIDSAAEKRALRKGSASFYEDVFTVTSDGDSAAGEVVRLSAQTASEILNYAGLISRFACLFNHRHDVLHALAAIWAQQWPSRKEMPVLELFREFQAMWSRYLRFDLTERYDNFSSFDPLQLPAMEALSEIRRAVREGTLSLLDERPDSVHLPSGSFAALLETIPVRYRPIIGCSVFVQPADLWGRTWVLNRLFEGSGRYLSRYPAAMEEAMRGQFLSHLTARSSVEVDGEPTDLLDLMFTYGSMSNLRFPQTLRVLEVPGERLDLPSGRLVRLGDLRIVADLTMEEFRLVDAAGRQLIPVHLSSLNNLLMPTLLRFLSLFGPYETRQVFPRARLKMAGDVSFSCRLTCGNLVIRRMRWEITKSSLEEIAALSGAFAFRDLQLWRGERGLPRQVFAFEQMHKHGEPVQSFKPQYIDFSSPSLSSLFLSIARKNATGLIVEESLPVFSDFPPDAAGCRRAVEFQIDSLALQKGFQKRLPWWDSRKGDERMAKNEKTDRPDEVGGVEIEPLTDADLESVAGGTEAEAEVNSNVANACCSSNTANACC
jgi:hypothetical protein